MDQVSVLAMMSALTGTAVAGIIAIRQNNVCVYAFICIGLNTHTSIAI